MLEQLRLLTNLETNERKLLQIVLIGQSELRRMVARPELEQLAQRVIARYHLEALTALETAQYIQHRLAVAGLAGVDATPQESLADPDGVAAKVQGAIAGLVAQGADSVVLGGAAMAGMGARLVADVPLLDGIACGVRLLEGIVGLRLKRPATGSYAAPAGRIVAGVSASLAERLA